MPCPDNSYSKTISSTQCIKCPAGFEGTEDHTDCNIFKPGTYSPEPGSSCISCQYEMYSDAYGSTQCSYCPNGYKRTTHQQGCVKCLVGTYSDKTTY